ncbi:DUF4145 domain-containing protein [Paenibacillus soyae]|uniref:DUF4145 domain-containing protein n=1 Tax=Paenibacillus soyae TaxID=2969249 RepID=A0A9X2SE17_9BACL|nr:DUF4145 domain-containing protein [Paenibacillus soyae]MCR2807727.1 DUF4145 domain-containing protein [Paenibacillus soyae]
MSSFHFLEQIHDRLATLTKNAEQTLWSNPRSTLVGARLFGEELATYVSKEERIEPVYSIKQVERLQKLSQQEVISNEIRSSFEWLRMNGNAAAHDPKEVPIDLALTAHRQMFELASWFAEVYGPLSIEIPAYAMPTFTMESDNKEKSESKGSTNDIVISEQFQKLLNEQLESKLLPTLDEKFRDLQESFIRIAGNLEKWSKGAEKPINSETKVEVQSEGQQEPEVYRDDEEPSPSITDQAGMEIADFLMAKSFEVLDKRGNNGALWVMGGWEHKDFLFSLKSLGFYFRFARNGSQSTKRKPAWFLTGKDSSELRMIGPNFPTNGQTTPIIQDAENEIAVTVEEVEIISPKETNLAVEVTSASTVVNSEEPTDNVIPPEALRAVSMEAYAPSRLSDIASKLGVNVFQDWREEKLQELYRSQPKLLHDVLVQLWFFGFRFEGELSRFIKLEPHVAREELSGLSDAELKDMLPIDVVRLLERYGIRRASQLNGIPLRSLEWLLRSRYDDVMSIIEQHKVSAHSTPDDQRHENPIQSDLPKVIRFKDAEVVCAEPIAGMLISRLPISGCNALMNGLIMLKKDYVVADLPSDLSILAQLIKGVGERAIEKFFVQLKPIAEGNVTPLIGSEPFASVTEEDLQIKVSDCGEIRWNNLMLPLDESDLDMPLEPEFYSKCAKLIEALHGDGITKLGDLPAYLVELKRFSGVGVTAIDKFVVQLQIRLEHYRSKLAIQQKWVSMTPRERIDYSFNQLFEKWGRMWTDEAISSNRNMALMYFRWSESREGQKITLEQTGNVYNLTRERVRQIIRNVNGSLQPDLIDVSRALKEACALQNDFCFFKLNVSDVFFHELAVEALEYSGLTYVEEHGWWTIWEQERLQNVVEEMKQHLLSVLKGKLVTQEEIRGELDHIASELAVPSDFKVDVTNDLFNMTVDGYYYLKNAKKHDLVEMVFRQYPNGIEIYKRAGELLEKANRIKPDTFEKDRDFTSVVGRDEFADRAYLWGRGLYIHSSFVSSRPELIEKISNKALQLLEQRSPISVGRLYQLFSSELMESDIPNEYALYTMLRKEGSDQLAPLKFPHIWHKDDAFQLTNGELIKMFIREQQAAQTLESLRDEFVIKRGWKEFTLTFSITTDADFVNEDLGVIGLREFYPLLGSDLEIINDKLSVMLQQWGVIHISKLFEECEADCQRLGIRTTYLLYDLLQGQEQSKFRFVRYPLISSADQPIEEVTLQSIIEQFILEQEAEVPRELVFQWVTEEVGATETTLDSVLSRSKLIYYYSYGQFGEYIHRGHLGWTEDQESDVVNLIERLITAKQEDKYGYVKADEVLLTDQLPILKNALPWTLDLVVDYVRKSGKFRQLGSYDEIIVSIQNERVQNETDWIAYVLETEFNGNSLTKDFQQRLAELRYSSDGRFLIETLNLLERAQAPFFISGERIQLKQ